MKEPLARVDQLEDAVSEAITEEFDTRLATFCLQAVSNKVRFYGDNNWTDFNVPDHIQSLVLEVAARGYMNPSGYDLERGDMVTFGRDKQFAAGLKLTDQEVQMVRDSSSRTRKGWTSVAICRPDRYQGYFREMEVFRGFTTT